MTTQRYFVALEESEVLQLKTIIGKGVSKARVITRARVLLMANENGLGKTDKEISETLGVAEKTPKNVRRRYAWGGLSRALFDAPRPGKERKVTLKDEAEITSIACTTPPDGYGRWSLDLLREKVTENLGKSFGRTTIWRVLLRNQLKPWREKNLVYQGAG